MNQLGVEIPGGQILAEAEGHDLEQVFLGELSRPYGDHADAVAVV